ncbi:domain-containing protein [Phakopsora pachyrhizi]|uniref:U6 snRNA-associated Sm-like protein LSm1 n=1 Tax=Phakopsora pachyrhizi TaxID=170000 RepID=A0AAV0BU55_PHAPC|nr:domain-containing protein [Phakopsora pachyrhizi]
MDNFLANVPFTTSGALVDIVDKKIIVVLRDGRKFIGVLRSYDQFANLVLQDSMERIHVGIGTDPNNPLGKYADFWKGIFIIRGENVVLIGEIDLDKEDEAIEKCELESVDKVLEIQNKENQVILDTQKLKEKTLFGERGFGKEGDEDDRY